MLNVADKDALQGIINGDKNGLFKVMEDLNPATGGPVDENVGALVPKGPHGAVQEVTAANVAPNPNPNQPQPQPTPTLTNPNPNQPQP